jgi:LmbE family N-acetylglucosaminyl deacetylase
VKRVILAVLAHPDDESFGMGGTLAKYAENGVDVHLICATRGEAGEVASEYLTEFSSVGELRVAELHCAVQHLGLTSLTLLDYRDSGMAGAEDNLHPQALMNAPMNQVVKEITEKIRQLKPQVVLTFDPLGGYKHPDHIFIQQAATQAFHLAGDSAYRSGYQPYQPARLLYHTFPRWFVRFNIQLLKLLGKDPTKYGKNKDIDLTQLADDFPVHIRVNYAEFQDRKSAAAACHASQGGEGLTRGVYRWIGWLLGMGPEDHFMQAYPAPKNDQTARDLFAGL